MLERGWTPAGAAAGSARSGLGLRVLRRTRPLRRLGSPLELVRPLAACSPNAAPVGEELADADLQRRGASGIATSAPTTPSRKPPNSAATTMMNGSSSTARLWIRGWIT